MEQGKPVCEIVNIGQLQHHVFENGVEGTRAAQ